MPQAFQIIVSDDLYAAIERARESQNKREFTTTKRNAWVEAVLVEAVRKEFPTETESPAIVGG